LWNFLLVHRFQNNFIISGVIPAVTLPLGTSWNPLLFDFWIPACAGMTALFYSKYFRDITLTNLCIFLIKKISGKMDK